MRTGTVVDSGRITGHWHTTTAPNGCVSCVERTVTTITIYEAVRYGAVARRFARGFSQIEVQHGGETRLGTRFAQFDDGNAGAVARYSRAIRTN